MREAKAGEGRRVASSRRKSGTASREHEHRGEALPVANAGSGGARLASANSTADRAIDVLLLFTVEKPVWSTAEIAEHFQMPRSTTHRYISSLRGYALLVEDASGGWHLGPRFFPLARAARAATSIITIAAPFLQDLNNAFGEAVTLYERIGHDSVALDRCEAQHRVKLVYSRGQILPWPGAASAKVLLAFAMPGEQADMLSSMVPVRYTDKTITSIAALRKAISKIIRDGYAYSDQERDEGIRAIAAPIFSTGRGRYCITMSGPLFRMTDSKVPTMIARVCSTASSITEALRVAEI